MMYRLVFQMFTPHTSVLSMGRFLDFPWYYKRYVGVERGIYRERGRGPTSEEGEMVNVQIRTNQHPKNDPSIDISMGSKHLKDKAIHHGSKSTRYELSVGWSIVERVYRFSAGPP